MILRDFNGTAVIHFIFVIPLYDLLLLVYKGTNFFSKTQILRRNLLISSLEVSILAHIVSFLFLPIKYLTEFHKISFHTIL